MKSSILILVFTFSFFILKSQDFSLELWPHGAPNHNGMDEPEATDDGLRVKNVSRGELYVYLPGKDNNTGAAVVICPGGGYWIEAMGHEGYEMAEWLKSKGVAGIVLKYRLPYGNHDIPSGDAREALRIVRSNAAEWGINPNKIGIAGSSAGGHLAATVGTRFHDDCKAEITGNQDVSSRPDFMLLLYPVITFKEEFGHMGSRKNLIGEGNDWKLVEKYSNELHVTPETPPTFIVLADDDTGVVPRNSIEFYMALKENQIPAEMHIFARGGHGFGMKKMNLPVDKWPDLFHSWLKTIKVIE